MTPRTVVVVIPPGGAVTLFAAQTVLAKRWFRNRGGGDATFVTGGTASGAAGEATLSAGERFDAPYRTTLQVTAFSAAGATIEGEEWT